VPDHASRSSDRHGPLALLANLVGITVVLGLITLILTLGAGPWPDQGPTDPYRGPIATPTAAFPR
jgi:hypothetical protein